MAVRMPLCTRKGAVLFAKPKHSLQDTKVGYAHNPEGAYLKRSLLLFGGVGYRRTGFKWGRRCVAALPKPEHLWLSSNVKRAEIIGFNSYSARILMNTRFRRIQNVPGRHILPNNFSTFYIR